MGLVKDARREHQKFEDKRRKRQLAVYEMERYEVRRIIESKYGREYSNQAEDAPGPCIVIKEEGLYLYFKRHKSHEHGLNLMVTGGPVPESRLNVDSYFTFVFSMRDIGSVIEKYLKQREAKDLPLRR